MKKILKQKNKINRGFTLMETLVAIAIFTVSILALMEVLSQGISNTNYAKVKAEASYLAQEGVEYVRNIRDTFVLYDPVDSQTGWASFVNKITNSGCRSNNGCYFDSQTLNYSNPSQPITNITMTGCGNPSCPELLYNSTTGKYGYSSGDNSGFIRQIKLDKISNDEMKITSTVYWTQASGNYSIIFSENLFNWVE